MASVVKIIATEQEAYNIGGKGTPVAKKMATEARAMALGCKITGPMTEKGNKLVAKMDLAKDFKSLGKLTKKRGTLTADANGSTYEYDLVWERSPASAGGLGAINLTLAYTHGTQRVIQDITVSGNSTSAKGSGKLAYASSSGVLLFTLSEVIPEEGYSFS